MDATAIVILSLNALTLAGFIVLLGLVIRYRKHKVLIASSPWVLMTSLAAGILLLIEVPIALTTTSLGIEETLGSRSGAALSPGALLTQWMHQLGFLALYTPLLLRTWRISQICRSKPLLCRLRTSSVLWRMGGIFSICLLYLIIITILQSLLPDIVIQYRTVIMEIIPAAGQLLLIFWGGHLCYITRRAPALYNDTAPLSYSLWNQSTWILVCAAVSVMAPHEGGVELHAAKVQVTTTTTIVLLIVPKLYTILHKHKGGREKLRNEEGVFDHKHVHQLLQLTTQQEELTSVQCQPCGGGGPVMYSSLETGDEEEQGGSGGGGVGGTGGAYHQQQKQQGETDEKHYSKAEVDALIDMVTQLKEERDKYRVRYRQLYDNASRHTTPATPQLCPLLTSPLGLSQFLFGGKGSPIGLSQAYLNGKCSPIGLSQAYLNGGKGCSSAGGGVGGCLPHAGLASRASLASTATTYISSRATTPGAENGAEDLERGYDNRQRKEGGDGGDGKRGGGIQLRSPSTSIASDLLWRGNVSSPHTDLSIAQTWSLNNNNKHNDTSSNNTHHHQQDEHHNHQQQQQNRRPSSLYWQQHHQNPSHHHQYQHHHHNYHAPTVSAATTQNNNNVPGLSRNLNVLVYI